MSAEVPPQGANYSPYGGSAAAELVNEAASVGAVHYARSAPPRIWNKRVQRRARRLERAATRLGVRLTGKLVDADAIVALLEEARADAVHAHHDTGSTRRFHNILPLQHLIDFAGDIDRVHQLAADAIRMTVDHLHHCLEPFVKGAVRTVGLEFVILHKIDTAFGQRPHRGGSGFGGKSHAGLHNRADQGSFEDSG